jgi:hypothetical protein
MMNRITKARLARLCRSHLVNPVNPVQHGARKKPRDLNERKKRMG